MSVPDLYNNEIQTIEGCLKKRLEVIDAICSMYRSFMSSISSYQDSIEATRQLFTSEFEEKGGDEVVGPSIEWCRKYFLPTDPITKFRKEFNSKIETAFNILRESNEEKSEVIKEQIEAAKNKIKEKMELYETAHAEYIDFCKSVEDSSLQLATDPTELAKVDEMRHEALNKERQIFQQHKELVTHIRRYALEIETAIANFEMDEKIFQDEFKKIGLNFAQIVSALGDEYIAISEQSTADLPPLKQGVVQKPTPEALQKFDVPHPTFNISDFLKGTTVFATLMERTFQCEDDRPVILLGDENGNAYVEDFLTGEVIKVNRDKLKPLKSKLVVKKMNQDFDSCVGSVKVGTYLLALMNDQPELSCITPYGDHVLVPGQLLDSC